MDEVHGSLAYDGASLLSVPVCVSRAFLVGLGLQINCYFGTYDTYFMHRMQ